MNDRARPCCEVRIEGVLDSDWTTWFDGLDVATDGSQTILSGYLEDQAARHGVLSKIRDLGLQLVSVCRQDVDPQAPDEERR